MFPYLQLLYVLPLSNVFSFQCLPVLMNSHKTWIHLPHCTHWCCWRPEACSLFLSSSPLHCCLPPQPFFCSYLNVFHAKLSCALSTSSCKEIKICSRQGVWSETLFNLKMAWNISLATENQLTRWSKLGKIAWYITLPLFLISKTNQREIGHTHTK